MLSNEDLNLKLAGLAGEVALISAGMSRVERALEGFVVHSRTIAELVIQHEHTQQALKDVRADNEACLDTHSRTSANQSKELAATTASVNEIRSMTRGAIMAGSVFTTIATMVAAAACSYIFTQVSKNTEINLVQQQRLEQLERVIPRAYQADR